LPAFRGEFFRATCWRVHAGKRAAGVGKFPRSAECLGCPLLQRTLLFLVLVKLQDGDSGVGAQQLVRGACWGKTKFNTQAHPYREAVDGVFKGIGLHQDSTPVGADSGCPPGCCRAWLEGEAVAAPVGCGDSRGLVLQHHRVVGGADVSRVGWWVATDHWCHLLLFPRCCVVLTSANVYDITIVLRVGASGARATHGAQNPP
jgi:hypothetical protein